MARRRRAHAPCVDPSGTRATPAEGQAIVSRARGGRRAAAAAASSAASLAAAASSSASSSAAARPSSPATPQVRTSVAASPSSTPGSAQDVPSQQSSDVEWPICVNSFATDSQETERGVVHYPLQHRGLPWQRRRCRSAPAIPTAALRNADSLGSPGAWAERLPRDRRPEKRTRKLMEKLSISEVTAIAYAYGPELLCGREDRAVAERLLPIPSPSAGSQRSRRQKRVIHSFLSGLSWNELIDALRHIASKRLTDLETSRAAADERDKAKLDSKVASWRYFEDVCVTLLRSHLRDMASGSPVGAFDGSCSVTWRMGNLCKQLGVYSLWQDVTRRSGHGRTIVLLSRQVPRLEEELRRLQDCVPQCWVIRSRAISAAKLTQVLSDCEVLYIAGKHDHTLAKVVEQSCVTQSVSLAILNTCRSERLARRLLVKGVQHVICWPADVHDEDAARFGATLVSCLLESSIDDSFARASLGVRSSERQPLLLKQSATTQTTRVILERRGHSGSQSHHGMPATVLLHTASNGWVHVRVGSDRISWRLGHWREQCSTADADCHKSASMSRRLRLRGKGPAQRDITAQHPDATRPRKRQRSASPRSLMCIGNPRPRLRRAVACELFSPLRSRVYLVSEEIFPMGDCGTADTLSLEKPTDPTVISHCAVIPCTPRLCRSMAREVFESPLSQSQQIHPCCADSCFLRVS